MSAEGSPYSGTTRVLTVDVTRERTDAAAEALRELIDSLPHHPNLLPIIDAGVRDGHPFIVTPPVTGESLDAALQTYGPAVLADALPRLQQLADALDAAAAAGFCHGALAPSEILIAGDETLVAGVGVAPALERAGIAVTAPHGYTAPEVIGGDESSAAGDQYALAIIACEWLLGRRPDPEGLAGHVTGAAGVDTERFAAAFATATARRPVDRFASCSAFVSAVAASAAPREEARVLDFATVPDELPLSNAAGREELPVVTLTRTESRGFGVSAVATALVLGGALGATAMWMLASGRAARGPQSVAEGNPASPVSSGTSAMLDEPAGTPPGDVTEAVITPARDVAAPESPRATRADAAPAGQIDAALLVHSTPSGAVVTVDGVARGATPVAIRGLALGTRVVVVSRPGYREVARQVVLTTQRPSRTLEIDLLPTPRQSAAAAPQARAVREGSVVIESRPTGATVFVDGERAGVTPLTMLLPAGEHSVRLEHAGHRPVTTRVDVKASERTRVAARLEAGQEKE